MYTLYATFSSFFLFKLTWKYVNMGTNSYKIYLTSLKCMKSKFHLFKQKKKLYLELCIWHIGACIVTFFEDARKMKITIYSTVCILLILHNIINSLYAAHDVTNSSQSTTIGIHIFTTLNDQLFARFFICKKKIRKWDTKNIWMYHTLYPPRRLSVMARLLLYKDLMMYIGDDILQKKKERKKLERILNSTVKEKVKKLYWKMNANFL